MAIKVNLLPAEFKVSGSTAKFLKISRMLGVISMAAFLVFALGVAAFLIFSSFELNDINNANTAYRNQLNTLKTSETQLVVVKDRLAKIAIAEKTPSSIKNLIAIEPFLASLSPSTVVSGLDIDPGKIASAMVFKSNADLTNFIKSFSESQVFKSVSLNSFSYNPAAGYTLSVAITSK